MTAITGNKLTDAEAADRRVIQILATMAAVEASMRRQDRALDNAYIPVQHTLRLIVMIKNADMYCAAVWKISLPGIAAETDQQTTIPIATKVRSGDKRSSPKHTQIREENY